MSNWTTVGFNLYLDPYAIFFDYMSYNLHGSTSLFALISKETFSKIDADCIWALWQTKIQMQSVR